MKGTLVAWLATCGAMGCFAMRYSDIEKLDVRSCPHLDSCSLIEAGDFNSRNCECDQDCTFYKDCCIDAAARTTTSGTRDVCMPIGDSYLGAYMVATCPEGSESTLVDQCEKDDFRDPLLSIPVTHASSLSTYRNSYCAQCNGVSQGLQNWILRLECPDAGTFKWEDVKKIPGGWAARNHTCELHFDRPTDLRGGPRLCRANLTDTCPPNTSPGLIRACKAYLAMVVDLDLVTYRNWHCALCNGKTVNDLSCFSGTTLERAKQVFSFALLVDVNRSDGDLVGISTPYCPDGYKYDPFFKKCRELSCAIPGYKMSNGKCVKKNASDCPDGYKYDPYFKKCRELVCAIPGYTISNGKCVKNRP